MNKALKLLENTPTRRVRQLYEDQDYTVLYTTRFDKMHQRDPFATNPGLLDI